MSKKLTYKYIEKEFNKEGYTLLSKKYINARTKLQTICPNGHEWDTTWGNFKTGYRCSKCSGREVTLETCIAVTDPWMVKYFKNEEDSYNYSYGSHKKVKVICPNCGAEKMIVINNFYKCKSIGCSCGDGISYSEKILISVLNQLNIKYEREFSPNWSNSRRYDFYLPNYSIIIECHGEQHYKQTGRKEARSLEEEQENDKLKEQLALQNKIDNYIILDCRNSDLNWIEQSIINSKLSEMFDLSNIDWIKCEEFALSNQIKRVCDYWHLHNEINNGNLNTVDIGNVFNLERTTIIKYLKKGTKLGWCNYNGKEEMIKSGKATGKPVEIFKNGKSLGVFESCHELERQSEKLFGVKLGHSAISAVCRGKQNTHRGYTFHYVTKDNLIK